MGCGSNGIFLFEKKETAQSLGGFNVQRRKTML